MALNGGSSFTSSRRAFLLFVDCETQEEVDDLWERLEGGEPGPCGLADGQAPRLVADRHRGGWASC